MPNMDKLDVAIIRELTQSGMILPSRPGFAPSYRQVSKKLGIPFGTIRNRISGIYKSGVLKGSSIYPNPSLFNLKGRAFTFDVPRSLNKEEVFGKLKLMEDVFSGHNLVGGKAWIVFLYKDEQDLERKLLLFKESIGGVGIDSSLPFPPCPSSLSQSEGQLILELSRNGLASYAQLGRKLKTSQRSLKRRIAKVVRENMILSVPEIDYSAISGSVPADLLIFFDNNGKARAMAEPKALDVVKDYIIFAALFDTVGMCSLVLPRVAQVSEIVASIKQIDGINEAHVDIVHEHILQSKILEKYLVKKIVRT